MGGWPSRPTAAVSFRVFGTASTLGTPIAIMVENRDHANWLAAMSPAASRRRARETRTPDHPSPRSRRSYGDGQARAPRHAQRARARERPRDGRSSGRWSRLQAFARRVGSHRAGEGDRASAESPRWGKPIWRSPSQSTGRRWRRRRWAAPMRGLSKQMCEAIDRARTAGESLGGVFEIWCWGVCPGSGRLCALGGPAGRPAAGCRSDPSPPSRESRSVTRSPTPPCRDRRCTTRS